MTALDGNAIGGLLHDVFGGEMTDALGVCAHCGRSAQVAETIVYLRGPGTVARCPHCANIVMVFVERRGVTCVDLLGLSSLVAR